MKLPCRHCGTRKANRPRGLCWACYYAPGVREQYPSTSKFGRRGKAGRVDLPTERFDWRRELPPFTLPLPPSRLVLGEDRLLIPRRIYDRIGNRRYRRYEQ